MLPFTSVHKDCSFKYFNKFLSKHNWWSPIKSSRSQMFFKIVVLKNFAIFTGKHLHKSLYFRMPENTDQENSKYGHFPRSVISTHSRLVLYFYTPWKPLFSDVFRGYRNGVLVWNGLNILKTLIWYFYF